jgi:hypothetical protein
MGNYLSTAYSMQIFKVVCWVVVNNIIAGTEA